MRGWFLSSKFCSPGGMCRGLADLALGKFIMVLLLGVLFLVPKITKNFYLSELWLEFEPGEEYTLQGDTYFLKDQSKVDYYPDVSDVVKKIEGQREPGVGRLLWSELRSGSDNSLGLRLSWDRIGSHFVDIIPSKGFLNFSAKSITEISLWVWSGNYRHELLAIFSKKDGEQTVIPLTKLDFIGWNEVAVKIPEELKIGNKDAYLVDEDFYFDRFRVYTHKRDKIANVYLFLDNFEVKREIHRDDYYDGRSLIPTIKRELGIGNNSPSDQESVSGETTTGDEQNPNPDQTTESN